MSTHAIAIARERVEMSKRDLESAQRSGNVSRGEHAKRHLTEATGDLAVALEAESKRTHPARPAPTPAAPAPTPKAAPVESSGPAPTPSWETPQTPERKAAAARVWSNRARRDAGYARLCAQGIAAGSEYDAEMLRLVPAEERAEVKAALARALPGVALAL